MSEGLRRIRVGLEIAKLDVAIGALRRMRNELANRQRPIKELIEKAAQEGVEEIKTADAHIEALQDLSHSSN